MDTPSDAAIEAWTRLTRVASDVLTGIESDLRAAGFPPLAWYDALLELRRAPDGLRPFELQRAMLLAQYNLSRLLDRLERAGLIARTAVPEDGRGQRLHLSPAGADLLARMWPSYRDAIARRFASRLTDAQAGALCELLDKVRG